MKSSVGFGGSENFTEKRIFNDCIVIESFKNFVEPLDPRLNVICDVPGENWYNAIGIPTSSCTNFPLERHI